MLRIALGRDPKASSPAETPAKRYDQAYFDRWYRDRRYCVRSSLYLERRVRLAVAVAEYFLEREVRSVLDVGCGEGAWLAPLRRARPRVAYLGLDPSEYAVARYGRRRNVRPASFGQLAELRFGRTFDLIVCSDVLHYLPPRELTRGLAGLVEMLEGVAYLDTLTVEDRPMGDLTGFHARSAVWYRRSFRRAGLTGCGPNCYVGPCLSDRVSALERVG